MGEGQARDRGREFPATCHLPLLAFRSGREHLGPACLPTLGNATSTTMTSPNDSDKRGCGDRGEGRLPFLSARRSIPPFSVTPRTASYRVSEGVSGCSLTLVRQHVEHCDRQRVKLAHCHLYGSSVTLPCGLDRCLLETSRSSSKADL
jgi:hypothetical protein